jgi:hypothetical protein
MSDDVLATMPSSGMTIMRPEDCTLLLRLCTVMNWEPKLPLHIMRDESAKRWFMKGKPGAQDYWIRDSDIDVLKATPMWPTVQTAKEAIMKAVLEGLPLPPKEHPITGKKIDSFFVDDPGELELDPVERDKAEAAKAREASEAALRKLDEWE